MRTRTIPPVLDFTHARLSSQRRAGMVNVRSTVLRHCRTRARTDTFRNVSGDAWPNKAWGRRWRLFMCDSSSTCRYVIAVPLRVQVDEDAPSLGKTGVNVGAAGRLLHRSALASQATLLIHLFSFLSCTVAATCLELVTNDNRVGNVDGRSQSRQQSEIGNSTTM